MHFNFHFTTVQTLWTLTLAAHLVLLVVLLGRDRTRRFRWFSLGIALVTLRLLASRLLFGRMPQVTLGELFMGLALISVIVGLLVIVELARMVFGKLSLRAWGLGSIAALAGSGLVLAAWGPWPALASVVPNSIFNAVNLLQLVAQKGAMLVDLLSIALGLLMVLFGFRLGTGWRRHPQRVVIGLSTASLGQLAMQGIWLAITKSATPHTMADYEHIMGLREQLLNANSALYVVVLVWWIYCLWIDEPGAAAAVAVQPAEDASA
ncbi:MAG: hypothetical protein WCA37_03020 [Terracidiphilus sp.]